MSATTTLARVTALPVAQRAALAIGAVAVVGGVVYTLWPSTVAPPSKPPTEADAEAPVAKSSVGDAAAPTTTNGTAATEVKKDYNLAHVARTAGNDLFKKEKYTAAVEKYTDAIRLSPEENKDAAKYFSNRAACYAKLKQWDQVVADCGDAIKIDKGYMRAYTRRGRAYEQLGELDLALNDYAIVGAAEQERLEKDPKAARKIDQETTKSIEALLEKIGERLADKRMKEHKGSFHSKKLMSSYIETFEGPHKEKLEGEDIAGLESNESKTANDWYKLGRLRLLNKEYTPAFEAFGESIERELTVKTTLEYAMLQHLAGSEDEAIALLETCLGRTGDRATWEEPKGLDSKEKAEALVKLANIVFLKEGPEGRWEEIFTDALECEPDFAVVHFHLAQTYCQLTTQQQAHLMKAIEHLNKCLESNGVDMYTALCTLQSCYTALPGYENKALEVYNKAIELEPKKPEAFNMRGQWFQSTGRYNEAMAEFERAIQADPSSGIAYSNKGFILLQLSAQQAEQQQVSEKDQMDNMLAASALYNEAIKKDPECLEAHINLAMLYVQINQIDNAINSYDTAISISTNKRDLATIYGFREAARMRKKLMASR